MAKARTQRLVFALRIVHDNGWYPAYATPATSSQSRSARGPPNRVVSQGSAARETASERDHDERPIHKKNKLEKPQC
jgi:hypothetical protein